jgi:phosphatidylglycerol---prolipoprotein diacylglyceryl transferase
MRPTLFQLGAVPIHSYGFLIAIGMVLGVVAAVRRGRTVGISTADTLDLTFYAIVLGLLGSRLLYVVMHAGDYVRVCAGTGAPRTARRLFSDCTAALQFWQGGLVFLGGGVLAAAVVLRSARKRGLGLGDVADVLAPSVSLAHVFGRLGCFMVGCCYGKPWDYGVHFPPGSVAYDELLGRSLIAGSASTQGLHPTQLYEAAGELVIFVGLTLLWRRRRFPGMVALAYAGAYGLLRFAIEMFRGDQVRGFLFQLPLPAIARAFGLPAGEPLLLSSAQASALALVAVAAVASMVLRRRLAKTARAASFQPPSP